MSEPYRIEYEFRFKNGMKKRFDIKLDPRTINLIRPYPKNRMKWTEIDFKQCDICPVDKKRFPYCPIALNIADLTDEFKNMISYDKCLVSCKTPERTYLKKTSIMEGLSSIFGIIMATSNCPLMDLFRPMARFHLPFSTVEETVVRSISFYMLRQYFKHKNNKIPDLELNNLEKHYSKIQSVNKGILERMTSVAENDADKNAVVILHSLGQILNNEIDKNLNSLEYLFDNEAV